MKSHRFTTLVILFFFFGLVLGSCAPAAATYKEELFYRDRGTSTQSGYEFIQFYDNGFFTYCSVERNEPGLTVETVYEDSCKRFLVLVPGATGLPGEAGNYVIVGKQITLNYPSVEDYTRLFGAYSPEQLQITASDGSVREYIPYPHEE